jgi:hypothetical protein
MPIEALALNPQARTALLQAAKSRSSAQTERLSRSASVEGPHAVTDITKKSGIRNRIVRLFSRVKNYIKQKVTSVRVAERPADLDIIERHEIGLGSGNLTIGSAAAPIESDSKASKARRISEFAEEAREIREKTLKIALFYKSQATALSERLENIGEYFEMADTVLESVETVASLKGGIQKWQRYNQDIQEFSQLLEKGRSALEETCSLDARASGAVYSFGGRTGPQMIQQYLDPGTDHVTRNKLVECFQSNGVSSSFIETLKSLRQLKAKLAAIKMHARDYKVKFGLTTTKSTIGALKGTTIEAAKIFRFSSSTLSTSVLGAGVGLAALTTPFSARALIRAGKSFFRSITSNANYKKLEANLSVRPQQKSYLHRIRKNVHRVSRKRLVSTSFNMFSSVGGVVGGALTLAAAASPIGLVIGAAVFTVGLGFSIFNIFRARRHAKKITKTKQRITQFRASMKNALARIQNSAKEDKASILRVYGIRNEEHLTHLAKLMDSETLTLDTGPDNKADFEILGKLYEHELGKAEQSLLSTGDIWEKSMKALGSNPDGPEVANYREKIEERAKAIRAKLSKKGFFASIRNRFLRSKIGGRKGSLEARIYAYAKRQTVAELKEYKRSFIVQDKKGNPLYTSIRDLQKRDENMVDEMFQKLYTDLPEEEDRHALVGFYSDVSVSKGMEDGNEELLSSSERESHTQFSRLIK